MSHAQRQGVLVVHLESPNRGQQGDHIYRTHQPCRALGEMENVVVISGSLLSPAITTSGLLEEADVLVLCDVMDPDFLPVIDARRRRGRLSAYEINDNFLSPQPWSPTAYLATNLVSRSLSSQLGRQSDCLQFTVGELDRRFGQLNPRRRVLPNHLWEMPPSALTPTSRDRPGFVRLGWGGSLGHREDLAWMMPALRSTLSRHAEVKLAVMGDPSFQELFAWVPQGRFEFTPGGSIDQYYDFLAGLHIGLAPLLPTEFNRCRSDIKFIEYAAFGVLAICSDLEPYRTTVRSGERGLLFDSLPALERAIDRAVLDEEGRQALTRAAKLYVAAERLERPHATERLGFYLSSAASLGLALSSTGLAAVGERLKETVGARNLEDARLFGPGYLAFGQGETEQLLHSGVLFQQAGKPEEARRCFEEAMQRAPSFYLAPLLLAGVEPDRAKASAAYRKAGALNPHSCRVPFSLGALYQEMGDREAAAREFERCRDLAPSFGAAQTRLGELAEAAGRTEEACRFYQEAALQNGYLATPVARLSQLALREGKADKAVRLLEQSLESDPDLWLTNFFIGRAYLELKRFHQARVHLQRALPQADDRAAVLAQLARAELGLGNLDAARMALEEMKRT